MPVSALEGLPDDWIADHPAVGDEVSHHGVPRHPPVPDLLGDADARRAVAPAFLNVAWPGQRAGARRAARAAARAGHAAGLPRLAVVRRRGQDDRHRPGHRRVRRRDRRRRPAGRRARPRGAAGAGPPEDPSVEAIDMANWRYYAELVRRERFELDAQEVRAYFDFGKVRQGLLDVTGRLFGLALRAGPRRARLARRRGDVRRAPGRASRSGGSTSTCTRARASTTTPRSSTWCPGCATSSCPRACWSATSRAG